MTLGEALPGIYPWQLSFFSGPMQCRLLRKARSFLVPVHWQRNHATSVNPVSYWLIRTGWIFMPERPIRATPLTCRTRLPFCVIVSSPQLLSEVPTRALCDLIPAARLQVGPKQRGSTPTRSYARSCHGSALHLMLWPEYSVQTTLAWTSSVNRDGRGALQSYAASVA